jgi:hypothetical protein
VTGSATVATRGRNDAIILTDHRALELLSGRPWPASNARKILEMLTNEIGGTLATWIVGRSRILARVSSHSMQ